MITKRYELRENKEEVQKIRTYFTELERAQNSEGDILQISTNVACPHFSKTYHIKDATLRVEIGFTPNEFFWDYASLNFTAATESKIKKAVSLLERKVKVNITRE